MDLPTINITGKFYAPDGSPLANAPVSVTLTRMSVDPSTGITVPTKRSFVTDANGAVAMDLWPNTMGDAPSFYTISIADTLGRSYPLEPVCVPHQDADGNPITTAKLSELAATGITWAAGESILLQAQQAVSAAESSAGTAASQAGRAEGEADRAQGVADGLLAAGDEQVARVKTEGDGQVARLGSEGDTQVARVIATNNATEVNAGRAEAARTGAELAEQAAKEHADSAAAVVTGGTGSLTPEPGKMPVADGRGKLAWGWLDLAAIRLAELQNPLVHLFKKNHLMATLSGALTWERATPATYIDRFGVMQTALANKGREEAQGWLFEGPSTNWMLTSGDLSQWGQSSVNTLEVALSAEKGPDGVTPLWQITLVDAVNDDCFVGRSVKFSVGTDLTGSVFVKRGNHSSCCLRVLTVKASVTQLDASLDFDFDSGEFTRVPDWAVAHKQYVGNGIWRLGVSVQTDGTHDTAILRVHVGNRFEQAVGATLLAWGGQLENLPFPSSYIATSDAPTTRTADRVTVAGPNEPIGPCSVLMEVSPKAQIGDWPDIYTGEFIERRIEFGKKGENYLTAFEGDSNTGTVNIKAVRDFISGQKYKIASVVSTDAFSVYNDGEVVASSATVPKFARRGNMVEFNYNYGAFFHIRDFRFYDFPLTAAELAVLHKGAIDNA